MAESHRDTVSRRLETIPGMGPVRVAQALAILVTPKRFRTKRQLWSNAGLGIVMRSSSDWVRKEERWVRSDVSAPRGLNPRCNHQLRQIFKSAATTAINQAATSPLGEQYARLVSGETKPNLAKLRVARKIAAVFLALWKSGEVYDPARTR